MTSFWQECLLFHHIHLSFAGFAPVVSTNLTTSGSSHEASDRVQFEDSEECFYCCIIMPEIYWKKLMQTIMGKIGKTQ